MFATAALCAVPVLMRFCSMCLLAVKWTNPCQCHQSGAFNGVQTEC